MKPRVLVLHAVGTNRDREAAWACELAGASAEIITVQALLAAPERLGQAQMLVLPGGFSNGDDLGAGVTWALALKHGLRDALGGFVDAGKPVLGICNGFQALIKAGLLPGGERADAPDGLTFDDTTWPTRRHITLGRNARARFECRWVVLRPEPGSVSVFVRGLSAPIFCPIAHGEGRLLTDEPQTLRALESAGMIALRYAAPDGSPLDPDAECYPHAPNGSHGHIAAISNRRGNVLGLMPHPEDHLCAMQRPDASSGGRGWLGLPLFAAGIRYAAGVRYAAER